MTAWVDSTGPSAEWAQNISTNEPSNHTNEYGTYHVGPLVLLWRRRYDRGRWCRHEHRLVLAPFLCLWGLDGCSGALVAGWLACAEPALGWLLLVVFLVRRVDDVVWRLGQWEGTVDGHGLVCDDGGHVAVVLDAPVPDADRDPC